MTRALTMSALPRTFACPSSFVLPHRPYNGEDAEAGKANHAEMEGAVIARDYDKLPAKVAELLQGYDPESIYPEQAVSYDYVNDKARWLDKRESRDYSGSAPYEIWGTSDVLAVDRVQRRGLVVDWKRFEDVGAPDVNAQTTGYAIALARLFDLDEVTVAISYLGEGKRHTEVATLDEGEFFAFRQRLTALNAIVAQATKTPGSFLHMSRHCRWCPAFHDCALQKQLSTDIDTGSIVHQVEKMMPLEDDEKARQAYEFLGKLRVFTKRVTEAVYARAKERPIPLASGKFFGPREKEGNRELDAETVYAIVRAKHGQEVADLSVVREATFTRLKEALKAAGVKSVAAEEKMIVAEVERLGGVSRSRKVEIEECTQEQLKRPDATAANLLLKEAG